MILRRVVPKLDAYLGREVPDRLAIRDYREIPAEVLFHGDVAYGREGDDYTAERSISRDAAVDHIDVVTRGGRRFSHWLFDLWPRLVLARYLRLTRHRVILNDNFAPYAGETLAALGLREDQLVRMTRKGLKLDPVRLWSIGDVRQGMWTPSWVIDSVRGQFLAPQSGPHRRLYISRNRAERRRTINEDEVLALLGPLKFETIYLEDVTLGQAAELFSQAELVVSPHGAGLANIVFCPPECRVVEFFSWHVSQEYWLLCNAMGLAYACVEGEGADGRRHFELTPREKQERDVFSPQDIRVPIDQLKRALSG